MPGPSLELSQPVNVAARRRPFSVKLTELPCAALGGLLRSDERFRCPGCGGMSRHTYHVRYPKPG
jgi:hypothetical protein